MEVEKNNEKIYVEKLNEILFLLSDINKKIDNLQCDVSDIKKQLSNVESNCNRMDGHISFVENTYDTLRHPINIFKATIEQVFGKGEDKESKMLN
jgi:archaellum component FlaC